MAASVQLIRQMGGDVVGCSFVIELPDLGGRKRLEALGANAQTLSAFEGGVGRGAFANGLNTPCGAIGGHH